MFPSTLPRRSETSSQQSASDPLQATEALLARARSRDATSLIIEHLPLRRLTDDQASSLSHIQNMTLRGTGLVELPDEIGRLRNLRTLTLSDNPISELPADIASLNLRALSIIPCPNLSQLPDYLAF